MAEVDVERKSEDFTSNKDNLIVKTKQKVKDCKRRFKRQQKIVANLAQIMCLRVKEMDGADKMSRKLQIKIEMKVHDVAVKEKEIECLKSNFKEELLLKRKCFQDELEAKIEGITSNIKIISTHKKDFVDQFELLQTKIRELEISRADLHMLTECKEMKLIESEINHDGNSYMDSRQDVLDFLETDLLDYPDPPSHKKEDHVASLAELKEFETLVKANGYRFLKKPKGPLFTAASIKNTKWSQLVEEILNKHLYMFLVDNHRDEEILKELIETFYGKPMNFMSTPIRRPTVKCSKFSSDDLITERPKENGGGILRLVDVLELSDSDFLNAVGKSNNLENTLLFDNEHKAFLFMSTSNLNKAKSMIAYTLDGFKIYPFPRYRTIKFKVRPRALYLKAFVDPELSDTITTLKTSIKDTKDEIDHVNQALNTKREEQLDTVEKIETCNKKFGCLEMKKKNLKKQLFDWINNVDMIKPMPLKAEETELHKYLMELKDLTASAKKLSDRITIKKLDLERMNSALEAEKQRLVQLHKVYHDHSDNFKQIQWQAKKDRALYLPQMAENSEIVEAMETDNIKKGADQ